MIRRASPARAYGAATVIWRFGQSRRATPPVPKTGWRVTRPSC